MRKTTAKTSETPELAIFDVASGDVLLHGPAQPISNVMAMINQSRAEYLKYKAGQPYETKAYLAGLVLLHELVTYCSPTHDAMYSAPSDTRLDVDYEHVEVLINCIDFLEVGTYVK